MHRIKRISIFVLAAFMLVGMLGCRKSETEFRNTYDFETLSGSGLPMGWTVVSYENQYEVSAEAGVVTLSSDVADDLRLTHIESVEPNTLYTMTAEVRTDGIRGGQGATLSIDNYGVDGSYIYSDALFGDQDWNTVSMTFRTAKGQESIVLALRIGGYSNVTNGSASFRNVSLEQCEGTEGRYQTLITAESGMEQQDGKTTEEYENVFTVIFWCFVLSVVILLFGIYRKREMLFSSEIRSGEKMLWFLGFVAIGFVVRLILCAVVGGHSTDLSCWISWGNQIADGRLAQFYDGTWYDYPPGYMYILGGLTSVMRLFGAGGWPETLRTFWYMLPAFLADIVCAFLMMRFCKKQGAADAVAIVLSGIILLNPAAMFLSGAWAQIDSILTALLLITFLLLNDRKWILAAVVYACAVLMKWQALIYGPVLAITYLAWALGQKERKNRIRALWQIAIAVVTAIAIILLASLPFRGNMSFFWIVERFLSASGGYDYASVEGYNYLTLLGGNWKPSSTMLLQGTDFLQAFGTINEIFGKLLMLIGIPVLTLRAWKTRPDPKKKEMTRELSILLTTIALLVIAKIIHYAVEASAGRNVHLHALVMLGAFGFALYPYWKRTGKIKKWDLPDEYRNSLPALAIGLSILLLTLLFGKMQTFKTFGTLQIVIGVLLTFWLLMLHRKAYLRCGKELHEDQGLPFLLSSFFMLWVFTFGHYMHERYVFPVLFLLLFAFAFYREKRFLLIALLLTSTTFLNEMTALYVVSEGAIDVIRGGAIHEQMLRFCSLLEVAAALYATSVFFLHGWNLKPEQGPPPFVIKRLDAVAVQQKKGKKGGPKHG